MDAFLSRKRGHDIAQLTEPSILHSSAEEEPDTDIKLAILCSLFPRCSAEILLEALLEAQGSVEEAQKRLGNVQDDCPPRKKLSSNGLAGYQSSLATFAGLQDSQPSPKKLTKKGRTLHLFSPEDIANHTPCSLIHNFLPTALADALLNELLLESVSYKSETFRLFDNIVTSPHTMAFYVDNPSSANQDAGKGEEAQYAYNGNPIASIRTTLPQMRRAAGLVKTATNEEIRKRIREHQEGQRTCFESLHEWHPNTSFVNSYDGPKQSVGWHADQLTYLGPKAVIASLSLGVAREFRVRKVVARSPPDTMTGHEKRKRQEVERDDEEAQVAIHLPHNSLLVMHAGMQEEWKHSVAPAQTITPHPIAGNKRINITYRHYRDSFAPKYTPNCKCGVAGVLKCVMKGAAGNRGRYLWMCCSGYNAERGRNGCGWMEFAKLDKDGDLLHDGS